MQFTWFPGCNSCELSLGRTAIHFSFLLNTALHRNGNIWGKPMEFAGLSTNRKTQEKFDRPSGFFVYDTFFRYRPRNRAARGRLFDAVLFSCRSISSVEICGKTATRFLTLTVAMFDIVTRVNSIIKLCFMAIVGLSSSIVLIWSYIFRYFVL